MRNIGPLWKRNVVKSPNSYWKTAGQKRTNLYIVDSVPDRIAQQFEICRLCDKDRRNSVGLRFTSELIDQLPQQGRMVTAETDRGPGIRTATAKEMGSCRQQPKEQLDGQISMMF